MGAELAPIAGGAAPPAMPRIDLHAAVLGGRNARTARAYRADFEDFARFLGATSPAVALDQLVALPHGLANAAALAYRAHLVDRQLAASTIARRLAALRSAVTLARQLGLVSWKLEVESPRVTAYRDTRGPGADGWRKIRATAEAEATGPRGRRNLALVRLLHDLALRRAEAIGLDLADVDIERGTVAVIGKGRTGRELMTLPAPTRAALADWIAVRGDIPGPLFTRLDRGASVAPGNTPARLTGRAVHKIVGALGRSAGLSRPVRPHGLRHQGITTVLEKSGGNLRAGLKFSRHAKPDTIMIYDDARQDLAGDMARLAAED